MSDFYQNSNTNDQYEQLDDLNIMSLYNNNIFNQIQIEDSYLFNKFNQKDIFYGNNNQEESTRDSSTISEDLRFNKENILEYQSKQDELMYHQFLQSPSSNGSTIIQGQDYHCMEQIQFQQEQEFNFVNKTNDDYFQNQNPNPNQNENNEIYNQQLAKDMYKFFPYKCFLKNCFQENCDWEFKQGNNKNPESAFINHVRSKQHQNLNNIYVQQIINDQVCCQACQTFYPNYQIMNEQHMLKNISEQDLNQHRSKPKQNHQKRKKDPQNDAFNFKRQIEQCLGQYIQNFFLDFYKEFKGFAAPSKLYKMASEDKNFQRILKDFFENKKNYIYEDFRHPKHKNKK